MAAKHLLLALMIFYYQSIALSHILTKVHMDLPLPTCMKFLVFTVVKDLCPIYGELASGNLRKHF